MYPTLFDNIFLFVGSKLWVLLLIIFVVSKLIYRLLSYPMRSQSNFAIFFVIFNSKFLRILFSPSCVYIPMHEVLLNQFFYSCQIGKNNHTKTNGSILAFESEQSMNSHLAIFNVQPCWTLFLVGCLDSHKNLNLKHI